MMLNTHTDGDVCVCVCVCVNNELSEQCCTYLVEILPLTPTAEFCASPTDNSTIFGILVLGPIHGNQHFSPVPG